MAGNLCTLLVDRWRFVIVIFCFESVGSSGAQESKRGCACETGCFYNSICTTSQECRSENVAFDKRASVSSRYNETYSSGPACVAVNGNTGVVYHSINDSSGETNCIHTLNGDHEWWQVDLNRTYTITTITIYGRQGFLYRMGNISITIDNQTCYTFPPDTNGLQNKIDLICNRPLTGRLIKLSTRNQYLNVCEFQVWVCKHGFFGESCDTACHCQDNATCDNYFGTCSTGCESGYYGLGCSQICGHCHDNTTCDEDTGQCLADCQSSWQEPLCKDCKGFYGKNCSKQCGHCKNGDPCDVLNGTCKECSDGYEPPLCNECTNKRYGLHCNVSCGHCRDYAACDRYSGTCVECESNFVMPMCTECTHGWFGLACERKCGICGGDGACKKDTGDCIHGCVLGWIHPLCSAKCLDGNYGDNCSQQCGYCNDSSTCDKITGVCLAGCQSGWQMPLCKYPYGAAGDQCQTGAIVGAVVGAGLFVGVSIIVAVVIWLRHSKVAHKHCVRGGTSKANCQGTGPDFTLHEIHAGEPIQNPLNTYEPLRPKDSLTDTTRAYEVISPSAANTRPHKKKHQLPKDSYYEFMPQKQKATDDSKPYDTINPPMASVFLDVHPSAVYANTE